MFCPHCGYLNTDADTVCQSCEKELYSHGPKFGGTSPTSRAESIGVKPEEEIKILKPWAIPDVKKEEEDEELSPTFQIKTTQVKKEIELKSRFLQNALVRLFLVVVVIAGIIYVINMFSKKFVKIRAPEEEIFQEMLKTGKDCFNPKLHLRRAKYYSDKKQYDKMIYDIDKAIKLDNNCHEAYFERGKFFFTVKNNPGTAIDSFNRAIEIKPNNVDYINNRAKVYEAMKEYDLAIADYTLYIKERPDRSAGYLNRGELYKKNNDLEKAAMDLEKASQMDMQSQEIKNALSDVYYEYGILLNEKGEKAKSIEYFEKSFSTNPQNIRAQNEIASFKYNLTKDLISQNNNKAAIEVISESLRVKPNFTEGYIKRAELYDITGDTDNAINDYQSAYDLDSRNKEVRIGLLKLLILRANEMDKKEEKDFAFSDYSRIVILDNKNAQAFLQRGLINYSRESYQRATEDLSTALQLDPKISKKKITKPLVKSHYEFGKILEGGQNYKEAANQYHLALKLDKNYKPAKKALEAIKNKI